MKKSAKRSASSVKIIIMLILGTVLLFIAGIIVLFSIFGNDIYFDFKAEELMPRARILSRQLTEEYYQKGLDLNSLEKRFYLSDLQSDSSIYIVDATGRVLTNDADLSIDKVNDVITEFFSGVMSGNEMSDSRTHAGVAVGTPIRDSNGNTVGAVILIQHTGGIARKSVDALSMKFAPLTILVLVLALLPIIIVFIYSTKPLRSISDAAIEMAKGDLSIRTKVSGGFVSKHLAQSFNTLAIALESNIDTLIIERNRLSAIIGGIAEGIIAVDKNAMITQFNPSAIMLLCGDSSIESPADLPLYSEISKVIISVLDGDKAERALIKNNGRTLSTTVAPIHEDNGTLCGAVAMIRDITESERLEQTRKDYVANVSHELRTPLASIRSISDALNDGLITDEEDKKRYYGYIQRESMRLSDLIDDLLELSRLQSGGVAFTKERVELYEILYDIADVMNESAHNRGISVRLLAPEGEYLSETNSARIEQILVALVDNAIKHGDDGCTVDIELFLSQRDNKYILAVSNAATIAPIDLEHIFERFYKADHAHAVEGTGLGLAIVSEVLNLLGERICVDYTNGIIRFIFTVERYASDGEHPNISIDSPASSPPLPPVIKAKIHSMIAESKHYD
ncbi:MAG: hypothetical protein IKS90_03615 [Clostridia bacterium]|nr:hypothetical protein [Clostridia bacterium]